MPGQRPPISGKRFWSAIPSKRSYRFRRADVAVFEEVKKSCSPPGKTPPFSTASVAPLHCSILRQHGVRAGHGRQRRWSQSGYVPLTQFDPRSPRPTIVALPVPDLMPTMESHQWADRGITAPGNRRFIDWLVKQQRLDCGGGRQGGFDPPSPHMRSLPPVPNFNSDVTGHMFAHSRARHLFPRAGGGRSFHDREGDHRSPECSDCHRVAKRRAQGFWPPLRGPFFA